MLYIIFPFFLFINVCQSFDVHHFSLLHSGLHLLKNPTNPINLPDIDNKIHQNLPIVNHHINNIKEVSSIVFDINKSILSNFQRNFVYGLVKTSSNILPNVDSIGHHVLHFNNVFIHKVIESKTLDFSEKKKLILWIINFTRKGDDTGSFVLQTYYDFVDKIMN